jgi:pimeloyl-ACP methyl ester carboxylesterase
VRVAVGDVHLYFDVQGCGLVAEGDSMLQRPTLILLHGGPGVDHTFLKPEFAAMADTAQVIFLDGARVEILAGVGHGVFRQPPEPAFARLKSFVDSL